MKRLLFATVLAIAAAAPIAASAQDEVIIRRHHVYNDNGDYNRNRDYGRRDRYSGRDGVRFGVTIGDNGLHRGWSHSRYYRRDCKTRWVKRWRHHRRVVEKITVCSRY